MALPATNNTDESSFTSQHPLSQTTSLDAQTSVPFPIDPYAYKVLKDSLGGGGGSSSSINGRSHGNTLTTISSGQANVAKNLNFQTNNFANGVTWAATSTGSLGFIITTPGQYLVGLTIRYIAPTTLTSDFAIINKNGSPISLAEEVGGFDMSAVCIDIIDCIAGDYFDFYAQTTDNTSGCTIDTGSGSTYCFITKV